MTSERKLTIGRLPYGRWLLCMAAVLAAAQSAQAQQSILGSNLIVNGNAEAGAAGTGPTDVVAIPGWTRTGNATVLPYGLTGYVLLSDPAPPDHGFNYFKGPAAGSSTLTQSINVSSGASAISEGNVEYAVTAYLGAFEGGDDVPVTLTVDFTNGNGGIFSTATIGPNAGFPADGLSMQQRIGYVPVGTVTITVTLTLNGANSTADSLSLVLNTASTTPALGANLLINGNAEAGPSGTHGQSAALYIPGWSTHGSSVCAYGGTGWIQTSDPGPTDRGTNLFCGYIGSSNSYQYIDVSAAASLIDAGHINYQVGAWLGGLGGVDSPTLTYYFYDVTGTNQLGPTATLGPVNHSGTALVNATHSDVLPAKTRFILVVLTFPGTDYLADDISFSIGNLGAPALTSALNGATAQSTIAASTYVAIYGTNLSTTNPGRQWAGPDFTTNANGTLSLPTSLDGTSVTVNGTPAYVEYISPTQLNIITPATAATGNDIPVIVSLNGQASATFSITLENLAPSFFAWDPATADAGKYLIAQHAATGTNVGKVGLFPGTSATFTTPAVPGETIVLYGTGFGPTSPPIAVGIVTDTTYNLSPTPTATLGGIPTTVGFAGLIAGFAEVYQFNVVIPTNAPNGDLPFLVKVNGAESFSGLITVQAP
jgi:uncharacterized protein (TIGR03437 family)